jgi:hypothetical protein
MSTYEPTPQERTATELTDFDGRPENCECWDTEAALPCFACYLEGFDVPNPNAGE